MSRRALVPLVLVLLSLFGMTLPRAAEAPAWLKAAMKREHPDTAGASSVVLLEERMMEVTGAKAHSRFRWAMKLLKAEGRDGMYLAAALGVKDRFKLVGAWKVRPDGDVTQFTKKDLVQADADRSNQISKTKLNVFRPESVRVGDVIAWEFDLTNKPETFQTGWIFGGPGRPTARSRFGLKIPSKWSYKESLRNLDSLESRTDDDGYLVWEMWNQPALAREKLGLPSAQRLPALYVAYGPDSRKHESRQFRSWEDVSDWYSHFFWPKVVADKSIRQAAKNASMGAAPGLDSIRAVTQFTQDVRYLNVARGGSMAEPHPAPMILKNRFGDCEDHAVLTIAMLRELGVEAYPVQVRTSDLGTIPEDFPTPIPFNHVVVAVKAPPGSDLPATIDAGDLGSLVVFDPTDSSSGFGDLSHYLQGMSAVITSHEVDRLVTLPELRPEDSRRESLVQVRFAADGGIEVEATATYTGQYGARQRRVYRRIRGAKRAENLSASLSAEYGRVHIDKFQVDGVESTSESIVKKITMRMPWPGKDLGSLRTMMPRFIFESRAERLPRETRQGPIRIPVGYQESDLTSIAIPKGWRVVRPLPDVQEHSEMGEYSLGAGEEGDHLILRRELTVRAATLPASSYEDVRSFFDNVAKADAISIAFEKVPPE